MVYNYVTMSNSIDFSKYVKPAKLKTFVDPKNPKQTLDSLNNINLETQKIVPEKLSQKTIASEARALLEESYSLPDFTTLEKSEQHLIGQLAEDYLNQLEVSANPNFGTQIDILSNDGKFFLYYSLEEAGRKDMIRSMSPVPKAEFISDTYDSIVSEEEKKEFLFGLESVEERRELAEHIADKQEIGLVENIAAEAKGVGKLSDLEKSELREPINKLFEDVVSFAGIDEIKEGGEIKNVFNYLRSISDIDSFMVVLENVKNNTKNSSAANLFVSTLEDIMIKNINQYNRLSPEEVTELINSFGI
jgi:hypothetical protein